MKRESYFAKLEEWNASPRRKPLILEGARQVGKTWLMKEFAKTHYKNIVYVRFDKDKILRDIFSKDFDVARIIRDLQTFSNKLIDSKNTIILFDEIQSCRDAITALKYIYEERPDLHIIAAGSLLGLTYRNGVGEAESTGFPVGKVNWMKIHPFSFVEFLDAVAQEQLAAIIRRGDWASMTTFNERITDFLRQYYVVGGMPEAVEVYVATQSFKEVREVHREILAGYMRDISKHAPEREVPRIESCWNSIPTQLAKENKKFQYSMLKKGGRASEFANPLRWLEDAGLIARVKRVTAPMLPLEGYADCAFKVFMLDIGLLSTMAGLSPKVVLEGSKIFKEFKGALTEQYVHQQLIAETSIKPYYYSTEDSQCEIDFVIQQGMGVCPLEVKAEENIHSQSLKAYRKKFAPEQSYRASMKNFDVQDGLINIPLAGICNL